jgi:hypothetical protein
VTARRAKRENGGLGEDPPGSTMTGRTDPKHLLVHDLAVPVTGRRAKRENGGPGEDPPGSNMTEASQRDLGGSPWRERPN